MIKRVLSQQRKGVINYGYETLESESFTTTTTTNQNCDQEENLRQKMQNQLGFCNGSTFRIVSVGDGSVRRIK